MIEGLVFIWIGMKLWQNASARLKKVRQAKRLMECGFYSEALEVLGYDQQGRKLK